MKESDELIRMLREILKNNLTSEAGSAILGQMARSHSDPEEKVLTVSVYDKADDDSLLPIPTPLHEFKFAAHEYELALETMSTYDTDKFDVSIIFGNFSKRAANSIHISPYFEFISAQAPTDSVLSGTKSEYVGEA